MVYLIPITSIPDEGNPTRVPWCGGRAEGETRADVQVSVGTKDEVLKAGVEKVIEALVHPK